MSEPSITIYGTEWCGDCRRARFFLKRNNIEYQWIDIDKDKQAEAYVIKVNNGYRSVPTIVFADGTILVEPSTATLANKLQIPSPA